MGVALFNQSLMLAAVRSTSCHAGGKPTGYVSLMDKKGEKGGKKRRRRSESAGCVDQRNRKTAETLICPQSRIATVRIERKTGVELNERVESYQVQYEPPP